MKEKSTVRGDRPLLIMRLRSDHARPDIWERTFAQLKRYRECADEVWFSTGQGIPPLAEHEEQSARIAVYAEELRRIGIAPSLQIQSTIGHGDATSGNSDTSAMNWQPYIGRNGEVCRYSSCPRQKGFLDYLASLCRIYAKWHPASVWVDDDLRLHNHAPACDPCGCHCPDCLALFSQREGRKFTREELVSGCEADPLLQSRWEKFGEESLCQVMETVCRTFHEYSPETRFGLQHDHKRSRLAVCDAMRRVTGAAPSSRPGGCAYSDHNPYELIEKAFFLAAQKYEECQYGSFAQICAEIESCPRVFTGKTSQGHRIESLLDLALGLDSLSYFILDPFFETPEWYGKHLLAPLAAEAGSYRDFIRHNADALPCGIGFAGRPDAPGPVTRLGLPLIGIPVCGASPLSRARMLTAGMIGSLTDPELEKILSGNLILDGAAALAVIRRGMAGLIGNVTVSKIGDAMYDYGTDDPLNSGLEGIAHYPLSQERFVFDALPEGARVLTRYQHHSGRDCGVAAMLSERPDGTRFALIGYDGFNTVFASSSRVRLLNRLADFVGHSLPVFAEDPVQLLIVPDTLPDGTLKSVTLLNTVIGKQDPFSLCLRGVPERSPVYWCIPSEDPQPLELRREKTGMCVTVPEIAPWGIGWLKITS